MNKKKIKLAVFDIDGVLNEHGGNIMPESIEAIKLLRANGIRVCFASGKHAWYVHGGLVWSGLLDNQTLIVAENGGVVYDPQSRRTLIEDAHIQDVRLFRTIYRNTMCHDSGFIKFAGIKVWEEPKETLFCLFPERENDVHRLSIQLNEIVELNNLNLQIVENPDSVDVLQRGINKATGVAYILKWLHLTFDDVVAFGDNYNDLDLLKVVGYPVTVANGVPEVKEIVVDRGGYAAHGRCGVGVLEAIQNYVLK